MGRYLAEGRFESLARLVRTNAKAVPRPVGVETTLIGELLNLLSSAGVPLPEGLRSPYGIFITLSPLESAAVEKGIEEFMESADLDTLSRDPALILYFEEPDLVKRGIQYLKKGLRIPSGYDALLLLAR